MPKLYWLYVCENDLMGNAINHANRVALYGVQIEQEGIWPTAQLQLIAREASLWCSHMCKCCQGSDSTVAPTRARATLALGMDERGQGTHEIPSALPCYPQWATRLTHLPSMHFGGRKECLQLIYW